MYKIILGRRIPSFLFGTRSFLTWKSNVDFLKQELQFTKELMKNQNQLLAKDKENQLLAKDKEILAKEKDKEILAKDNEILSLNYQLKSSNLQVLVERQSYSVRAAVETLLLHRYPEKPRGMEEKLRMYLNEDPYLRKTYAQVCHKLNCSNYADKAPRNLYHNMSSKVHGGGFPINCSISNSNLSVAEWSLVISLFKMNLPKEAFNVYDNQGNLMDI